MPRSHSKTPDAAAGNGAGRRGDVAGRVGSLGRAARGFSEELRTTAADLGRALDLRGRVQRHPYAMMAAAVGIGYVLGGGLFTRTTARVLGLAGRLGGIPGVKNELFGLAEAVLSGAAGQEAGPPGSGIPSPS